jgi:serine/threonine protein kinase
MIQREYDLGKDLNHQNIQKVRALQRDEANDRYYLVKEMAAGVSCDKISSWSDDQIVEVVKGVVAALEYLHAKGVIHRDLKPSNIVVDRDGDRIKSVRIIDLGGAIAERALVRAIMLHLNLYREMLARHLIILHLVPPS